MDLSLGTAQVVPDTSALDDLVRRANHEGRPLRVKFGVDPTGSDLTLGHAVALRALRRFQDAGHLVVLVVGGFTARLGDPTGRSATRGVLSAEEVRANAEHYLAQALRVLDGSPEKLEVVNNAHWLEPMTLPEVLELAASMTLAQLLERDDFSKRFAAKAPLSLSELFYPLFQGLDSVEVRSDVELGGTDQLFNMMVGRSLQKDAGLAPQVVVTVPILEGLDGVAKMSKSLGNFVAITEDPREQFGKLMSIPDPVVARYAELVLGLVGDDLADLAARSSSGGKLANDAKRELARAVVDLFSPGHGEAAEAAFDAQSQRVAPLDAPEVVLDAFSTDGSVHLPGLLEALGMAPSRAQARRLLAEGAVRVNEVAVAELDMPTTELTGRTLRVGKRKFARLV
jgi:tyrosyl-tRNA synthetase